MVEIRKSTRIHFCNQIRRHVTPCGVLAKLHCSNCDTCLSHWNNNVLTDTLISTKLYHSYKATMF